ncbi:MAG: hypothetical protein JO257_29570, partial [Deltaproteobacteria bacterium]|nr:hypothetical protein [Deltaproteobacteria bacterium]
MMRFVIAVTLLAACRGGSSHRASARHDAGSVPASAVSVVPRLPRSPDGVAEMNRVDAEIALAKEPFIAMPLVLLRASMRGRLDDFQDALARSEAWLAAAPTQQAAIRTRVEVLERVHRFADARALLGKLKDPADLALAIDEATEAPEAALPARKAAMDAWPTPTHIVSYAATLALAGKIDEALATMQKAAAAVHDNAPELLAWMLFQWGRIYELDSRFAEARDLFAAAHARMPAYLEATAHLAQAMDATGDRAGAQKLVDEALADNRHPELLGLAVRLGHAELTDEAKREWERYVAALPLAFSDHAARFYLTVDPARALVLAKANLANRDTPEARALVGEAALAAGDPAAACEAVAPLVDAKAPKAQRFIAWRALTKCGRTEEAERL